MSGPASTLQRSSLDCFVAAAHHVRPNQSIAERALVLHTIGASYLSTALAYGWQDVTTERSVGNDRLTARFNTDTFAGRIEGGHRFVDPRLGVGLTPYAAGQFTTIDLPTYGEIAGATNMFGLNYTAKDATVTRSELGLRTDKSFDVADGIMTLRGRAAWAHNFNSDRSINATFQTLPGASFVVNGAAQGRDAALVTGSAELKWRNNWAIAATFEGEFSHVTRSYAGKRAWCVTPGSRPAPSKAMDGERSSARASQNSGSLGCPETVFSVNAVTLHCGWQSARSRLDQRCLAIHRQTHRSRLLPQDKFPQGLSVPSGRVSRLARFVSLASGVAGGMVRDGARQLADGKRPSLQELLLTPANALKVAHQLAHLRGAAMKVGQLLSMDAGEILPRELADILGRLRSDAHHMPQHQVRAVLDRQWGRDWQGRFDRFSFQPIAAASIGQVHRAWTKDGRDMAIKIQYPGVRQSIDSDVDNVSSLLRISGLLPRGLDVSPMLREAKRQLHEEADYDREGRNLSQFAELLAGSPDYILPVMHADLTGKNVLAMSYLEGTGLESLASAPQAERDRIVTLLIDLVLRELFEFRLMQTDPNFANYRYNVATRRLVLLDFGAVRAFPPTVTDQYRDLLTAGIAGDRAAATRAMRELGLMAMQTPRAREDAVMTLFEMAMQPLRYDGAFDFGTTDIMKRLRDGGMAIAADREHWHIPPMDTLFLQRKIGGIFLLATRLKARVPITALLDKYLR